MARKGGRGPSRKGGKSGSKPAGTQTDTPGVPGRLVPWNQLMRLTDSMRFPALVEQVYNVVQSASFNAWLTAPLTPGTIAGANLSVTLGQFSDNLSALTGLFDQYRINCVEAWLKPATGIVGATAAPAGSELYTMLDYDSGVTPTSIAAANGYSTCIQSEIGETQKRTFKPRVAYAAYSGAFTSYANQQAGWIDCASPGVLHYGMLAICTASPSATVAPAWDLQVRAHISFRSTH